MSAVKRIRVPNRLAAVVRKPGGKTIADAVAGAEANLEAIRDDCVAAVDAILAAMIELSTLLKAMPTPENQAKLYGLADEMIGVAGIAHLPAVGTAAFSVCELVDAFSETGAWNWEAVAVHLNGLKLLRAMGDQIDDAAREQVLDGLRAVVKRVGAAEA
jgi:hypothetical protein